MTLPVKKVHVDTAFRTLDSRSNSHFRFELPESLTFPDNTVMYVDDVAVPHAWRTVEPGINDRFYFVADGNHYAVSLTSQVYTGASLAGELETRMNAAILLSNPFEVTYSASTNEISISTMLAGFEFSVLTSNDLATKLGGQWTGPAYDRRNPQDINGDMLKQTEGSGTTHRYSEPWVSGSINLQPIRVLYVYSPNIGHFQTIGPNGERSIIKSIPVSAGPGYMIFDQVLAGNDYIDVSRQTHRTLEFMLKDHRGNLVPLHGSSWSFSLVFDQMSPNS